MSANTVAVIVGVSLILGTVGGLLERFAKAGGGWYKLGVVLGSLGTDLASLAKMGGVQATALIIVIAGASEATALSACTATQEAAIIKYDQAALPLTSLGCTIVNVADGADPVTTLACTLLEGVEGVVAKLPVPEAAAADAGPVTAMLAKGSTVLLPVPASQLPSVLSQVRLVVPDAGASVGAAQSVVQAVTAPVVVDAGGQ